MPFNLTEVDLGADPTALSDNAPTVHLVSHASFHLDELVPIAHALAELGLRPRVMLVEATAGVLKPLRSQHRRYRRSVEHLRTLGLHGSTRRLSSSDLDPADALVVMNDWGPCRELVEATRASGGISFGKVEGAQDFADVDTGRDRGAYRSVDVVLCQGRNDYEGMIGTDREVVGNSRLERILAAPVRRSCEGPVVVNSNFSYGQLSEHRSAWLSSAHRACRTASAPYRISRHPADLGMIPPWRTTRTRIEDAIVEAPTLISRFSTVCFEALAQGVPLAYFNPHGEQAAPFTEPDGAFQILRSEAELSRSLERSLTLSSEAVRANALPFLRRQVDIGDAPPGERAARVIAERLSG